MKKIVDSIDGDTFALKIENDTRYKGRYLIFIRFETDIYNEEDKAELKHYSINELNKLFRVKLSKSKELPNSFEELEKLPYIIFSSECYAKRHFPLDSRLTYEEIEESRKHIKFFPDKYNYLYSYLLMMSKYKSRNIIKNFVFIGNYKLSPPKDEYFPVSKYNSGYCFYINAEEYCIKCYHEHNLQEGLKYSEEEAKRRNELAEKELEFEIALKEKLREMDFSNFKITSISGWGTGLYDCDTALDMKEDYRKFLKENNNNFKRTIEDMKDYYEDFLKDKEEKTIFWMVMADQGQKGNVLTDEIKDKALKAIENNLKIWKKLEPENYNNRKEKLYRLKNRLNK